MDDGVAPGEIVGFEIADVAPPARNRALNGQERVVAEVADVEAAHIVAARGQQRAEHRADISFVSGDQDLHRHTLHGARPSSHMLVSSSYSRNVSMHCQKLV